MVLLSGKAFGAQPQPELSLPTSGGERNTARKASAPQFFHRCIFTIHKDCRNTINEQ